MAARWQRVRNLLAVRLDNLGDVLMSSPALAAIAESLPAARITLLGSPSGVALSAHLPMLDDAIEWRAPWVKHAGHVGDADLGRAEGRAIDLLAARRFDAAVIFTTCTQSALPAALLCRMAGIPLRLAHSRENPYDLLTDWVPETEPAEQVRGIHDGRRQPGLGGVGGADRRPAVDVVGRDRGEADAVTEHPVGAQHQDPSPGGGAHRPAADRASRARR